jgi:undecaprenyl-diphosphatase
MLDRDGMMSGSRRNSLVLFLLLAVVATVLTSLLFIPDVVNADRQAFLYLNSLQDLNLESVFWTITVLGSLEFGLIWFGGMWLMRRSDLAAYLLVAILIEVVVITFMKEAVMRHRPFETITHIGWLYSQESWSFPSGHAAGAFTLATVIGLKVKRTLPLMAVIASLVAFSRIYVGVHFPMDVIAGSLIGILIGLLTVSLDLRRLESRLDRGRSYLSRKLGFAPDRKAIK